MLRGDAHDGRHWRKAPVTGATGSVRLTGCLLPGLMLVLLAMPLAELALLIWAAGAIGFWWTLLLCIATAVTGSAIARWQGAVVLRRAQEAVQRGEVPAAEVLDGVLLIVGGVLLLTPGFITDAAGFTLLLPPTRGVLTRALRRWWSRQRGIIDVA